MSGQKDLKAAIQRAKERGINYKVLDSAPCEKCGADCRQDVGRWVVDGMCGKCRPDLSSK